MLVEIADEVITPRGIRIPVTSVKGRCPRPLDDGGVYETEFMILQIVLSCQVSIKKFGTKVVRINYFS